MARSTHLAEHHHRLARLRAAASIVASDPPMLPRGDLEDTLDAALALVPDGATPIVFHSAVLYYVCKEGRRRFAAQLDRHDGLVWISNEAPGVVDGLTHQPPAACLRPVPRTSSSVAVNGPWGSRTRTAVGSAGRHPTDRRRFARNGRGGGNDQQGDDWSRGCHRRRHLDDGAGGAG